MARNFSTYWPRHDRETPSASRDLMKSVVTQRFANVREESKGIFILPAEHGRVRSGLAPLTPDLLRFPDIDFFAKKNPKHVEGCELCCLGRVDWHLIFATALKIMRRPKRKTLSISDPVTRDTTRDISQEATHA